MTSTRTLIARIGDIFAVLRSAAAVSGAVESGYRPRAHDLARLGIDARAFAAIGRG